MFLTNATPCAVVSVFAVCCISITNLLRLSELVTVTANAERIVKYYDSIETVEHVLARNCKCDSLWMNMGYEEEGTPLQFMADRSRLLAIKFAEFAGLSEADEFVLDIGGGFGDQAMMFVSLFGVQQIVALNLSPMQNDIGAKRVERAGLAHHIHFTTGNAQHLKFPAKTFDKVLVLDAVMHWTRTDDEVATFYSAVARILKPGGRLVMSDMHWADETLLQNRSSVLYQLGQGRTQTEYVQSLLDAGFSDPVLKYMPGRRSLFNHQQFQTLGHTLPSGLPRNWQIAADSDVAHHGEGHLFDGMSYFFVSAVKTRAPQD